MAKRINYTQRTLAELEKQGARAAVVEKWITIPNVPGGGVRRDMFGLFDIVAIRNGIIVGIQSTSIACKKKHVDSMFSNENLKPWLMAGAWAELWLWKKVPHGKTSSYFLTIQGIVINRT